MTRKVQLIGDIVTIPHSVLVLILSELVHDCVLDRLLLYTNGTHLIGNVRVFHFVLAQPKNEVVGEFLNSPENVYIFCVLLRFDLLHF